MMAISFLALEERMKAEGMIKQENEKIQPEGLKEDNVEAENEPDDNEAKIEIVKVKKPKAKPKPKANPKPKKKIVYVEESSSDDEEEIIYRKRRPRTHYTFFTAGCFSKKRAIFLAFFCWALTRIAKVFILRSSNHTV